MNGPLIIRISSARRAYNDKQKADSPRADIWPMPPSFTLEYWLDEGWYVGRVREVPGVFSQGQSLAELQENIQDAYRMLRENDLLPEGARH